MALGKTEITLADAVEIIRISPREIPNWMWSDTGVGKSETMTEMVNFVGWKLKSMIAQVLTPPDVGGLPWLDRSQEVPVVRFSTPSLLPHPANDGDEGVWFVDELPNAARNVQAALQTIFTQGSLNEYVFPSGWKQVAAGNRLTDRANTFEIPRPVANRFMHLYVKPELKTFLEWGSRETSEVSAQSRSGVSFPKVADITKGKPLLHPFVRSFLAMRPEMLHQSTEGFEAFATPRTWRYTSLVLYTDPPEELLPPMLEGLVGPAAGAEMLTFLADTAILPPMKNFLLPDSNKDKAKLVAKQDGGTMRTFLHGRAGGAPLQASHLYAIAMGIGSIVDTADEAETSRFFDTVESIGTKDVQLVAVREAVLRDPTLSTDPRASQWGADLRLRLGR